MFQAGSAVCVLRRCLKSVCRKLGTVRRATEAICSRCDQRVAAAAQRVTSFGVNAVHVGRSLKNAATVTQNMARATQEHLSLATGDFVRTTLKYSRRDSPFIPPGRKNGRRGVMSLDGGIDAKSHAPADNSCRSDLGL
jgi:hypothetical protein